MEINPNANQAQYHKEVQEGKQIFQKSFQEMQKSKMEPQKQEFSKAANESLKAIHDSAKALMNTELQKQTQQLKDDFNAYQNDPTEENANRVSSDLDTIQ
jgi:hypothetical protein